ncbi:MAG: hypothetical protein HZA48_03540 [Planctomycetes bacterium]|nr:hypothetical protein [Planctomycetota bacterium]
MPRFIQIFILIMTISTSCTENRENHPTDALPSQKSSPLPLSDILTGLLGQKVTIQGTARNAKLGALVETRFWGEHTIWIDSLSDWDEQYCDKTIKVTGILEERHDLPMFISKPGEAIRQGMSVPEGTNLFEASKRYLLKNAKWELVK